MNPLTPRTQIAPGLQLFVGVEKGGGKSVNSYSPQSNGNLSDAQQFLFLPYLAIILPAKEKELLVLGSRRKVSTIC